MENFDTEKLVPRKESTSLSVTGCVLWMVLLGILGTLIFLVVSVIQARSEMNALVERFDNATMEMNRLKVTAMCFFGKYKEAEELNVFGKFFAFLVGYSGAEEC